MLITQRARSIAASHAPPEMQSEYGRRALEHWDAEVRRTAIALLQACPHKDALAAILSVEQDPTPSVRIAVAFALANAVVIAVYTVVDALGARAAGNALQYVLAVRLRLVPTDGFGRTEADHAVAVVHTDYVAQVSLLTLLAQRMRADGAGRIVVFSSIAGARVRRANYVYGSAKAGLDGFAAGLADALHGTAVQLLIVRPGFVIGRMTQGMDPAPMSSTPAQVADAQRHLLGVEVLGQRDGVLAALPDQVLELRRVDLAVRGQKLQQPGAQLVDVDRKSVV